MDLSKYDPTMDLAREAAECLGRPASVPRFLQADTLRKANARRAVFLMEVADPIEQDIGPIREGEFGNLIREKQIVSPSQLCEELRKYGARIADRLRKNERLRDIVARLLPELPELERISVALRMCAGYHDAAKVIAEETRAGKNQPEDRTKWIHVVDERARNDVIYAAGAVAAPFYKGTVRREAIFKDGIPEGSIVLQDWIDR